MTIPESELIINPDGSIYHLNLRPEQIADTIITVGDPDRVDNVSRYFDTIEHAVHRREFKTHTGTCNGKRLTAISTGIGTDNVDIVLNELDALVNVDFTTRKIKDNFTPLTLIRIGTSGAIQPEIPIDCFLVNETAIGFDNLMHFYDKTDFLDEKFSRAFTQHTHWSSEKSQPYVVRADDHLLKTFERDTVVKGITATNVGFYGPQGRVVRLGLQDPSLNDKIATFEFEGKKITNLEMETAGIYGLARLLGHRAISLNAILTNRATHTFSDQPDRTIDKLIQFTLSVLTK